MKKYEYRREQLSHHDTPEEATIKLNALGADGWQFIHLADHPTWTESPFIVAWFMREADD
jgi:hypothetical protein